MHKDDAQRGRQTSLRQELPNGWQYLEQLNLIEEMHLPINTLEDVPFAIRYDFKRIQAAVFNNLARAYANEDPSNVDCRIGAWKLFCLLSRLLLHRLRKSGTEGTKELTKRIRLFDSGRWDKLLEAAAATLPKSKRRNSLVPGSAEDWAQRLQKAEILAARGELSNAARLIRSNGLAPGDDNTLAQLTDPALRPQVRQKDLTMSVSEYLPDEHVQLDKERFISNLRRAR